MSSDIYGQESTDSAYLLERFELTDPELDTVRKYGLTLEGKWDQYVEEFYYWLKGQPEFGDFFEDADLLKNVQIRQTSYWKDFFLANVDSNYVERRKRLGELHAHIQLPLGSYLTAVNKSFSILTRSMRDEKMSDKEASTMKSAVAKLLNLDNTIIVGTFMAMTQQKIAEQTDALMQMSTPVAAIWDGILLLPIVGIIDSARASEIMNSILSKILETHAKVIILDISGVAVVDTAVANHLIKITKASKLMGCDCTITGMSPAVAQTIVELGIDTQHVTTTANLHDSLRMAFEEVGVVITKS
jgi:rsbT co-antagonist protein RsbR